MEKPMRGSLVRGSLGALLFVGLVSGCNPVKQDRSIHFSADGRQVVLNHGADGLFVADADGGTPQRIFRPGPDVLAISPPLFGPNRDDRRIVFCTARPEAGDAPPVPPQGAPRPDAPAGNICSERSVILTCYLRPDPGAGGGGEAEELFQVPCGHIGYVASGLAVRWHPDGRRLLIIRRVEGGHTLFTYELATKTWQRACPLVGADVVADCPGEGRFLACVLGGKEPGPEDGLWIGPVGGERAAWWRVPHGGTASGEFTSVLETLKASRPVFTPTGDQFAFAESGPRTGGGPTENALWLGDVSKQTVRLAARDVGPFHDLNWAPDGRRLGAVAGQADGTLLILETGAEVRVAERVSGVRQFAGWDHSGKTRAHTVADRLPYAEGARWAYLLVPNGIGRDALILTDAAGARTALEGVQISFTRWAPDGRKLSMWATWTPAYLTWQAAGRNVRPGDPAVLLDPASGALDWKAVNAHEKIQIAHLHLQKGDAAAAWRAYEEARHESPAPLSQTPEEALEAFLTGQDPSLFEYVCLKRLGRLDEAAARLAHFETAFPTTRKDGRDQGALRRLRDLYALEVFLSLNAVDEAEAWCRRGLAAAQANEVRLDRALLLGQVLLLRGQDADYARLMTETALPLLLAEGRLQQDPFAADLLGLLPLTRVEFLARLPEAEVRNLRSVCLALNPGAEAIPQVWLGVFEEAACRRLGLSVEADSIHVRQLTNPLWWNLFGPGGPDALLEDVERFRSGLPGLISWWSALR
jgi:hypothetical protein